MNVAFVVLGLLMASWLEYVHHRHAGHLRWFGCRLYRSHRQHHGDPTEGGVRFGRKVVRRAPLVVFLGGVATGGALPIIGWSAAPWFTAGLIAGYLFSEWYHHRMHHRPSTTRFGAWMRRYHYHHHFVDGRANYGFSTPLWDFLFGTARPVDQVAVPSHKVIPEMTRTPGISLRQTGPPDRSSSTDTGE